LLGDIHELAAQAAEDVVVFHSLLQAPDLFRVSEPPTDCFPAFLIGIEGIGTDEHRDIEVFPLGLKELTGDRSPAHLLQGGDVAEDFLALLAEFRELRHRTSFLLYLYNKLDNSWGFVNR
jgi:hypothetical protein